MFRILRWIVILAVLVGGVGYYRGWFRVHSHGDSTIKLKIDRDKIDKDKENAQQKIQDLRDK